MQKINLTVEPRSEGDRATKNPNQLRREGWIPAVLYGHGQPSVVVVNAKEFGKATHTKAGMNGLFTVKVGSETSLSIIKEVQRDIFTRQPIHIDFQRIDAKEKIEVTIPIHTKGEAVGVKVQHGILEYIQREIRVKCLPDDIPATIELDITTLELHHSVKVKDLPIPQGVEVLTASDHIVVTIVTPKIEEEKPKPGEAVAGALAQPEVIAKGKKDEEGAAAAPAAGAAPQAEGDKKKAAK